MKGFATVYLVAALAGAAVLAITAGVAYSAGKSSERAVWEHRENAAVNQANALLVEAGETITKLNAAHQAAMAEASTTFQKELKNVRIRKDRVIADLRSGAVRLRDPGTSHPGGQGALPQTAGSAGGCDDGAGSELSVELGEFLVSEASRADEVVWQLQACQAIVRADRAE